MIFQHELGMVAHQSFKHEGESWVKALNYIGYKGTNLLL